jgi:CRISPR-associated protein Cas2
MRRVLHLVVAYDVTCDRERSRVDRLLKGYGFRVQKSVFEVCTDNTGLRHLVAALSALGLETGHALLYRINQTGRAMAVGVRSEPAEEEAAFVV